ncbi:MAG: polyprenyl synthetase family protein [Acidobacteriota bacterium]|jgi:geranylgeranyl pyrophosphate synthase/predicted secreted hydrolase
MKITTAGDFAIADESLHADAPIEWWFVQGNYQSSRSRSREFMVSLLKHCGATRYSERTHGFSLLISVLDPATGRHAYLSQVDQTSVDLFIHLAPRIRKTNLDTTIIDACVGEISAHGPPSPICACASSPDLQSDPFRAVWQNFSLGHDSRHFDLTFQEPGTGSECVLRLSPEISRAHLEKLPFQNTGGMAYVMYPALALRGMAGGEPVTGQAWFDHQWGNYASFRMRSRAVQILGWDWWGIRLANDYHIMAVVHRDARQGKQLARYAVLMRQGQPPLVCSEFAARPVRYWKSEATHIRYPVAWDLSLPQLGTELRFDPMADDQEIPIFGVQRAIWEGAGTVSGTCQGRPITGRARMELAGYGYIFDVNRYIRKFADRIDRHIAGYFPKVIDESRLRQYVGAPSWKHEAGAYTKVLSGPIWDLMARQGKHWRSIFGILLLEALGVHSGPFEALLSVVAELSHTGALIIDDIEDNSLIRRGRKCIHLHYGLDIAINSANTAYFLPYLMLRDHPLLSRRQREAGYRILSEQSVRSHLGQGLDIYWSRQLTQRRLRQWMNDSLASKILQTYGYKTGAIVEGLAEFACVLAKADEGTSRVCRSFARVFGAAFQIVDDVLGFAGAAKLNKRSGEDLANGKITFPIFRALERLPQPERNRLRAILCSETLRAQRTALSEGISLVRNSGALEACRKEAQKMFDREWGHLAQKLPPTEPRMMLRALCAHLLAIET